jgi:hypothetical protein
MSQEADIQIGDRVQIRGSPATLAAELAGRIGRVQSIARPQQLPAPPIGMICDADACEVLVENSDTLVWIMAPLLLRIPAPDGDPNAKHMGT